MLELGHGAGVAVSMLVAGSLAAVVAAAGFLVVDRASLRRKLRDIDELYKLVDIRDQELMLPFRDRVAAPIVGVLTGIGHRFSPSGYTAEIRAMMRRAGRLDPAAGDRFLAIRATSLLGAPVLALVAYQATAAVSGPVRLAAPAVAVAACVVLPKSRLRNAVESRENAVRAQLPDVLDLLVICMEAGLGFTSALSRTVGNLDGELSDEFAIVLREMRAGANRSDALAGLGHRIQIPEIRTFVTALRQADQFGVSITAVLREQAEQMRVHRQQVAQEKAQKAPVKMLIPMVFCIFPPLFIVVIGPAVLQLTGSGGL